MKVHIFYRLHDIVDIHKFEVYRGPNIGIYSAVNDKVVFLPNGYTKSKGARLGEYLNVEVSYVSVANTRLIGTLMSFNNHGLLLPKTATESEYHHFKKTTDLNVEYLDSKFTALGNLICVNDKGAIVSPQMTRQCLKKIEDVLGVEAIQKRIAGYHQVGSMAKANMKGGIIHPEVADDDLRIFSNILGVKLEPATINGGVPFVSSGILANNHSVVVGSLTNGPEIMMLTRAFSN